MPLSIAQKLKVKPGHRLLTIHAPANFRQTLGVLPEDVSISDVTKDFDQIHWFVKNKTQLESEVTGVVTKLQPGVTCWIYYPKRSSSIQTDLTRDKGWEALLQHQHLQWISLVSFDDTWSVFGMRLKTAADEKKEAAPKQRAIFDYINPETKTVRLPEDLEAALSGAKSEKAFFDSLSFTNKKEYVEWIVSAKRPETRVARITSTIERLTKGWKNPANR